MAYTDVVGRGDSAALVPEEVSNEMLGRVGKSTSAAFQLFRRVPITSGQMRFPILSTLPNAYWVSGDTGLKQTTDQNWTNKFINVEELAVEVPVPRNVLQDVQDDGGFDLWGEIMPAVEEAIGRAFDDAVFFGVNAPSTFPTCIATDAEDRGFEHEASPEEANYVSQGGIQDDIDICIGQTEIVGFDPNGIVAARTLRGKLRKARSTIGERLTGVNPDITEYMGMDIAYPMRGLFPTGAKRVEAFIGDFSEYFAGIRKEIEYKVLDQAVLQDNTGAIVLNLAQQGMVAVQFTFRAGWQVSNRIRYDQKDETQRYPVSVLKSKT